MGGLLRLADRGKRSQINQAREMGADHFVETLLAMSSSPPARRSQATLYRLRLGRAAGFRLTLVFPRRRFGAFAATISYDCRIRSSNSSHRTASSRSSITHL